MQQEETKLEALIRGGLIGAALGATLAKDGEGATTGAIIGAAISATKQANREALQTQVPVYTEKNGKIYATSSDGTKVFIKDVIKIDKELPSQFKLK